MSAAREKHIITSTLIISGATLISRILGFVRDMIIAGFFGAGVVVDAFVVAFRLPNLLRRLFGEGSLSASFIPVFTEYLETKDVREAWELASNVLTLFCIILIFATITGILGAPLIVRILAPGFYKSPVKFNLTVRLTKILFPYLFLIGLVALSMGILNSLKHFVTPAISPALLNIGIIGGALLIAPHLQEPIIGIALGVLLGGLGQVIIQIPVLIKKGVSLYPNFSLKHPGTKKIGLLMIPALLGMGVTQINILIDTLLASFLPEGSISYLYYSNRLIQFPLALFGIALGTAIFPTLSRQAARNNFDELKETYSFGMRMVFFITIPSAIGLAVFGYPIINVLFQRGEFSAIATSATSKSLIAYCLGLWAYAGIKITVPVFYSFQDTATPVKIAIISMILNIILNIALMIPFKHVGLALATSLSATFNLIILTLILRKRLTKIGIRKIIMSSIKTLANSSIMGVVCFLFTPKALYHATESITARTVYLVIGIVGGIMLFFFLSYISHSDELLFFLSAIKKRVNKKKKEAL
ncbi:MAG: murein biosynthesis integral membrane protein MurJ [bacterium]